MHDGEMADALHEHIVLKHIPPERKKREMHILKIVRLMLLFVTHISELGQLL